MSSDLQNHSDAAAREWLDARVLANGRVCPHCGGTEDRIRKLEGKAHRPGLYQCNACREQFTATVGTVMERSSLAAEGIKGKRLAYLRPHDAARV